MRGRENRRQPELYGVAPVGISRYFALYITQIGWLALGPFLLSNAYWPSTCKPQDMPRRMGRSGPIPSRQW